MANDDITHFTRMATELAAGSDSAVAPAAKRGGPNRVTVSLDEALGQVEQRAGDVIEPEAALERLAGLSERQAKWVELRFFGVLTFEEAAEVVGIGLTTAKADWTIARAWLGQALKDESPS